MAKKRQFTITEKNILDVFRKCNEKLNSSPAREISSNELERNVRGFYEAKILTKRELNRCIKIIYGKH